VPQGTIIEVHVTALEQLLVVGLRFARVFGDY